MIEQILHGEQLLAIIVPRDFESPGITFVTPPDLTQQLAVMRRPTGWVVGAHAHRLVAREVRVTQEVLILKRGRVRVDFYDDEQRYLESRNLAAGDVIMLVSGGHGLEVLEEAELIEVKQGPFTGDDDKIRFPVAAPAVTRGPR
jgi:hypothetical protein